MMPGDSRLEDETASERDREREEVALQAFDVVDVLGGLCALERRSRTLGGSVPLRVAQACVPLLEGNAFGFQVVLRRRIEFRRKLGRFVATCEDEADVARLHRASLPMARAEGLLQDGAWKALLEGGIVTSKTSLSRDRATASLFTGLFVRPREGVVLRVSSTKNRRSFAHGVREAMIDRPEWVPLVLEIDAANDSFVLTGEIATLAPLPSASVFRRRTLDEAPEVAEAHLGFYDRAYFETKRSGAVSRKYRRLVAKHGNEATPASNREVVADVIDAGGAEHVSLGHPTLVHRAAGASHDVAARSDRFVVHNAVSFEVSFDGLEVRIDADRAGLETFGRAIRAAWNDTLARARPEASHPGALLYLTKYFTPHPPGEPHFFVKPAALFRTDPGTSMLLEGRSGSSFEIMRGVVESDVFHAAPAVFHLPFPRTRLTFEAGAPLLDVFPIPRALLGAQFAFRRAGAAVLEVRP